MSLRLENSSSGRPDAASGAAAPRTVDLGVYGCDPEEVGLFAELAPRFGIHADLLDAAVPDEDALPASGTRYVSVSHKVTVTAEALRALKDAGVTHLSTRSIGVDHIDLAAADELGITVENAMYAPDGVADFTLMLILMAVRDARRTVLDMVSREPSRTGPRGRDLRDMTIGVVGVGRIGSAVVDRLQGFGTRVLTHDGARARRAGEPDDVPFDELLRESDVVTLHFPLTPETHHLIGAAELSAMKPGAILVNTGRGALVDTAALVAALESGHLGGAALDVIEGEAGHFYADDMAAPGEHPHLRRLQDMPNTIISPHTAYYTERALRDTVEQTLEKVRGFEENRTHA